MNKLNKRKRKNKTKMWQRRSGWHWRHNGMQVKDRGICDGEKNTGGDGKATNKDVINNY